MPITRLLRSRRTVLLAACLLAVDSAVTVQGAERAAVAVVRSTTWSPGDTARDGAEEFAVLMVLARVQRENALAGLVGASSRHGVFQPGAERALRFAVLSGVPVAKVATTGDVAASPEALFIDAGMLSETEAGRLLATAIERVGAAPKAVNPSQPTESELAAIRSHVRRLQEQFLLAGGMQVARN